MDIWIQDRNTKRVIKAPASAMKALGPNWRRVNPPRDMAEAPDRTTPPPKQPDMETHQEPAKQAEEPASSKQTQEENPESKLTTRQDYLNALKQLGVSKKGLHLSSLEKLKKEYEDATSD